MIMTDKEHDNNIQRGIDLFSECLAGMMYSDEEILETMSPDDAREFLELRNSMLPDEPSHEIILGSYDTEDDKPHSLAAEDDENYK